jgi:hypothetical protein
MIFNVFSAKAFSSELENEFVIPFFSNRKLPFTLELNSILESVC